LHYEVTGGLIILFFMWQLYKLSMRVITERNIVPFSESKLRNYHKELFCVLVVAWIFAITTIAYDGYNFFSVPLMLIVITGHLTYQWYFSGIINLQGIHIRRYWHEWSKIKGYEWLPAEEVTYNGVTKTVHPIVLDLPEELIGSQYYFTNFSENRRFNIVDEDKAYVEELFQIYYDQLK